MLRAVLVLGLLSAVASVPTIRLQIQIDEESGGDAAADKVCRTHHSPHSCLKDEHCMWLDNWLSSDLCVVKQRRPDPHCERYPDHDLCEMAENCQWIHFLDPKNPGGGSCEQTPEHPHPKPPSTHLFLQFQEEVVRVSEKPLEAKQSKKCKKHHTPEKCLKDVHCVWKDNWLSADECVVKKRRPNPHCENYDSYDTCSAATNCEWIDYKDPKQPGRGSCEQTPENPDNEIYAAAVEESQSADEKAMAKADRLCHAHTTPAKCAKDEHCFWKDNWLSGDECTVKTRRPDPHCENYSSQDDCSQATNCQWIDYQDVEHPGRGSCQQTPEDLSDKVTEMFLAIMNHDHSHNSDSEAKARAEADRLCHLHLTPKKCNKDKTCHWQDNWLSADECVVKQRRPNPHCENYRKQDTCDAATNCQWIEYKSGHDDDNDRNRDRGSCQQTPEDDTDDIFEDDVEEAAETDKESKKREALEKICRSNTTPSKCDKDVHCRWEDNWWSNDACVVRERRPDPHCERFRSADQCSGAENCQWIDYHNEYSPQRGSCQQTHEDK